MEIREVDQKKVNNVMFKKIGVDVPVQSKSGRFESDHVPARALAISNRFGYTVFAHSQGFSVAKTADLVEVAQKLDVNAYGFKTAQEAGTITVDVTNLRSLTLSTDELTLCVCVGGDVMFYDMATLVHKSDTRAFEVWQVDPYDSTYARDFLWSPSKSDSYLVVTSQGKLLVGHIGSVADCKVEDGVLAASWSADGQHIAYVSDSLILSITTSNFATTFQHELPSHLSNEDEDSDLHVDAIRWVRPDSIVVGYSQVNSEGEEDEYPLFVLNSRNGNLAQEDSNLLGLVFYQLFPSADPYVVPSDSGPYMLSDYVKPWGLMVAASRKSIDDHIVLMGWFPEDGQDVLYSVELGNDAWIPRIELQESNEDNAILGLAIDRTTVQIELRDPTDESGDTMLPCAPVLVCLTLEGKLSFFSVARLGEQSNVPDFVTSPSEIPDAKRSIPKPSSHVTSKAATTIALVPDSPPVLKVVEVPEDELPPSELTTQTTVLHQGEDSKEEPSESGLTIRTRPAVKDQTELLKSASPPRPQGAAGDDNSEGSRLGSTLFSEDTEKSVAIPASPSLTTLKDLTGSVDVASTFQGLYRPFEEASKRGLVTAASPLQVQQGSQLPSAGPLPVTFSLTLPSGSLPTASAEGKGFEGESDANASVLLGPDSKGKGFQGGADVNPTVPLSPGLQGKGFQGDLPANASGPFGLSSLGKGFQVGPPAKSTVSLGPSLQGKDFQGLTSKNPNVSFSSASHGKGLQGGPAGNQGVAFGSSVKSPMGSSVAPKVVSSQRGADRFTSSRILQDQQSAGRVTGVIDMEVAFNAELAEVRKMSNDVDQLMAYIEGRWLGDLHDRPVAFTKQALEELEQGIHRLSEECKAFRVQLNKNKEAIEDLRDEEMRVDAWRIYIQSLMDQKNDSRYQELWKSQKLHPELDMKRKHLLKADQELKQHIAELEGHLHILELKQFQQDNARRRTSKSAQSPGRFLSVQNLYNTVNSQMAIAEELSSSLANQMEALNIRMSPTSKSTASKILKSIGADTDVSESLPSPLPRTKLSYSPAPKTGSMNGFSGQDKDTNLQEIRRKRDSMDAAWVNRETPRTTVKRVVRTGPIQNASPKDSTVPKFRQWLEASSDLPVTEKSHFLQSLQAGQSMGMVQRLTTQSHSDPDFEGSASSSRKTGMFDALSQWSQPQAQLELQPQEQPHGLQSARILLQAQLQGKIQGQSQAQPQAQPQAKPQAKLQSQPQAQLQAKSQPKPQAQLQAKPQGLLQAQLQPKPQAQPQPQLQAKPQGLLEAQLQPKSQAQSQAQPQAQLQPKPEAQLQANPQAQPHAQQIGPGQTFPSADLKGSLSAAYQGSAGQVMNVNSKESMFKWANPTAVTKPVLSVTKQSSGSLFVSSSVPAISAGGMIAATATASTFPVTTLTAGLLSQSASTSNATQASLVTSVSKPSAGSLTASASVPAVTVVTTPATTATTSIGSAPTVTQGVFSRTSSASNATEASASSGPGSTTSATSVANQSSGLLLASSAVPAASTVGTPVTAATTSIISAPTDSTRLFSGSSSTLNMGKAFASTGSLFSTSTPSMPNQSPGSPFASSSLPAYQTSSPQSIPPSLFGQSTFGQSSPFGQVPQQQQQPFLSPGVISSSTIPSATVALPPAESIEEDMEEEVSSSTVGLGSFGGFGGLGLGNSATGAQTQKSNPFGGSSFGASQPFQLTPPSGGQLFRPATFSLPAAQSSPQQSGGSTFGSGFGSSGFSQNNLFSETGKGFGSPPQSAGAFGQPAQLGPGQQALGNALGSFGQTRQVGFGTPFGNSGVGSASGGGFGNAAPGSGFGSAATGGGFAKAATGGGFAGAAMGGGFAGAAAGGGFADAASGGGFGSAGGAGGGFGNLGGGGFQAFAKNQASSPGFGGGVPPAQTTLFTQMRK